MSKMAKIIAQTTLCGFLLIFLLSGCAIAKKFGPYMGRVIDAETGEPIEGAIVFIKIMTVTPNVGGWQYHFANAKEVLTDSNGEFSIELLGGPLKPLHSWWPYPSFSIFKPGYGVFPNYPGTSVDILVKNTSHIFPENTYVTIRLPRLHTQEERKKNLLRAHDYENTEIPYDKRRMYFRMTNEERLAIGLRPLSVPKKIED